jgi:hypothetical protein
MVTGRRSAEESSGSALGRLWTGSTLRTGRRAVVFGSGAVGAAYFTPGSKATEDAAPFGQLGHGPGDTAADWWAPLVSEN